MSHLPGLGIRDSGFESRIPSPESRHGNMSKYWRVLHLLFVDDEPALRSLMAERLGERGFEVIEADSGEKAIQLLEQFAFDVVITDLRMPGIDGTRVIETALERYPSIVGIVITGYGTMKDAVEATKRGASDCS